MIKWIQKPSIIVGIGVGVGVVTCAVHVLRRQNQVEIISTESNRITRTLKIPKGFVGHVLGRGGSVIKGIREKTRAKITFDDTSKEFTLASVTGSPESVEEATDLINQIISNRHACVVKEIQLQENISDSVWKNVNCIKQICDLTRAKITFDFLPSRGKESNVKVTLKGRKEEVEAAAELIDELVSAAEVGSTKQIHVAGRALPENLALHSSGFGNRPLPCEKLIPNSSDGYVEVFVSAAESPSKFWVQICGSKSIQIDKLATEMTEFYNDEKNKERFQLDSINVGDIVSAFFQGDSSWYRAEVLQVLKNENSPKQITVFYLDFGDVSTLSPDLVSLLKPDFLSIPFQAIECSLYNVGPVSEDWSAEATELFGVLVHEGMWKMIMAKPMQKDPVNGEKDSSSSRVQYVQLMDTTGSQDVDVSEELVLKGLAKFL